MKFNLREAGAIVIDTKVKRLKGKFITPLPSNRTCRFIHEILTGEKLPVKTTFTEMEKKVLVLTCNKLRYSYSDLIGLLTEHLDESYLKVGSTNMAGYCYLLCESFFWMIGERRKQWTPVLEKLPEWNHWTLFNPSEKTYLDFPCPLVDEVRYHYPATKKG